MNHHEAPSRKSANDSAGPAEHCNTLAIPIALLCCFGSCGHYMNSGLQDFAGSIEGPGLEQMQVLESHRAHPDPTVSEKTERVKTVIEIGSW